MKSSNLNTQFLHIYATIIDLYIYFILLKPCIDQTKTLNLTKVTNILYSMMNTKSPNKSTQCFNVNTK